MAGHFQKIHEMNYLKSKNHLFILSFVIQQTKLRTTFNFSYLF